MNKKSCLLLFLMLPISVMPASSQDLPEHDRITTRVDTTAANELIMIQSFMVNATVQEAWSAYTTKEGYQSWAAPVADINLKVGGTIKANYNRGGSIGDDETITTHIINYVPQHLLTLQSEIPHDFPYFMKANEKNFFNVIEFNDRGEGQTEIISYGIGYKNTDQFRKVMHSFVDGNLQSYEQLISYLEG